MGRRRRQRLRAGAPPRRSRRHGYVGGTHGVRVSGPQGRGAQPCAPRSVHRSGQAPCGGEHPRDPRRCRVGRGRRRKRDRAGALGRRRRALGARRGPSPRRRSRAEQVPVPRDHPRVRAASGRRVFTFARRPECRSGGLVGSDGFRFGGPPGSPFAAGSKLLDRPFEHDVVCNRWAWAANGMAASRRREACTLRGCASPPVLLW